LFAHHAGIIGLESCDGGTTYDKHGAYALLLKDTGELEASCESRFTYRVPQNDKGKFRLTSATPASRDPVRVLRSHSINSIWGPKAGVRYEGLYSVRGWSIKQATSTDTSGGQWKEGDILFDVRFERTDQTPMETVINRPTATEIDDYAEYKRLRKLTRDDKDRKAKAVLGDQDPPPISKVIPPIMPPPSPLRAPSPLSFGLPPSALRKDMVKRLHFDEEARVRVIEQDEALSPKTAPIIDPLDLVAVVKNSTLAIPSRSNRANANTKTEPPSPKLARSPSPAGSNTSSVHTTHTIQTTASTMPKTDIREVAPWIDYDADLSIPSPPEEPLIIHQRPIIVQTAANPGSQRAQNTNSPKPKHREHLRSPVDSTVSSSPTKRFPDNRLEMRHEGDFKGMPGDALSLRHMVKKEKRKSIAGRKKNLMTKLFDGMLDDEDSELGGSSWVARTSLLSTGPTIPILTQRNRTTSWKKILRPYSHTLFSLDSPLRLPCNAICPTNETACLLSAIRAPNSNSSNTSIVVAVSYEDPFIETPALQPQKAMPMFMKNLASQSSFATINGTATCTPILGYTNSSSKSTDEGSTAEANLRKMVEQL
jgi:putative methyltransferase